MKFSKSWVDESGHIWFAVNMDIGEFRDEYIAREFHYAFTKTPANLSLFEEMFDFLKRFYKRCTWDKSDDCLLVIQKQLPDYSFKYLGEFEDKEKIIISIEVENFIITNIMIDIR